MVRAGQKCTRITMNEFRKFSIAYSWKPEEPWFCCETEVRGSHAPSLLEVSTTIGPFPKKGPQRAYFSRTGPPTRPLEEGAPDERPVKSYTSHGYVRRDHTIAIYVPYNFQTIPNRMILNVCICELHVSSLQRSSRIRSEAISLRKSLQKFCGIPVKIEFLETLYFSWLAKALAWKARSRWTHSNPYKKRW